MSSDDADDDDRLEGFFSAAEPNAAADLELVQEFLDLAAGVHFIPGCSVDGRAQAIIDNGFTSRHAIAELSESDLRAMNFLA